MSAAVRSLGTMTELRPFTIDVADEVLDDLLDRLRRARLLDDSDFGLCQCSGGRQQEQESEKVRCAGHRFTIWSKSQNGFAWTGQAD